MAYRCDTGTAGQRLQGITEDLLRGEEGEQAGCAVGHPEERAIHGRFASDQQARESEQGAHQDAADGIHQQVGAHRGIDAVLPQDGDIGRQQQSRLQDGD